MQGARRRSTVKREWECDHDVADRLIYLQHAMCADLTRRGGKLLNGPMDRPWGIRTAAFQDPGRHIWEIAK
jgi:hypothetical protein